LRALAAYLRYRTDRDPTADLDRWSTLCAPHEITAVLRAAADTQPEDGA
jgi:hypothetical protein